jgi:hydrogenase/urease accessory protein HupE
MRGRPVPALLIVCFIALAIPGAASAHGLHGEAQTIPGFIWLGVRHMIGGWDHVLFIAGIVLLAREARLAAKLISVFVLGHSVTLLLATLAGWQINANVVDAVIAASVAYIGLRILRGRPTVWAPTVLTIFAFGLVHGLGLSTRVQTITLPEGGALVARILAFNVGVEIGQLIALSILVGIGFLVTRDDRATTRAVRATAIALVAIGVVAGTALSFAAVKPDDSQAADVFRATCSKKPYSAPRSLGGGHPDRAFYPPGEGPPASDLVHVLGDGYVIVMYRIDLPDAQQSVLADWADRTPGVVAAPARVQAPNELEAITAEAVLTCNGVDTRRLAAFREQWLVTRRNP